jgi:predicted RNA-binding protein
MTYWLTIGTWEGWNTLTHNGILEIPKRDKKRFEKIKNGDKVLFSPNWILDQKVCFSQWL